jgi:uncharacterized membrane protein
MTAIALSPMVAFTKSSLSADAMTVALSFLLFALIVREAFDEGTISRRRMALLLAVAVCAGLAKQSSFVIALAVVMIPAWRMGGRVRWCAAVGATLGAAIGPALVWSAKVQSLWFQGHSGSNVHAQLVHVLSHPFGTLGVFLAELFHNRRDFLMGAMGDFGWLDTPLPGRVLAALTAMLVGVAFLDATDRRVGALVRTTSAVTAIAGALTVMGLLYLAWTGVGAAQVEGVQGRYFLPFAPLVLLPLASARVGRWSFAAVGRRVTFAAFVVGGLGAMIVAIARRYYALG